MTQEDRDKVERRVAEALSKAAPLRICESMKAAMEAYGQEAMDDDRRRRFKSYQYPLSAVKTDGLLHFGEWTRTPARRIYPLSGAINIAKKIRSHVAPSGPHRVFVDADYSNAHMRIAAVRSKDTALLAAFDTGSDCYDTLGAAVFPAVTDRKAVRSAMKLSALSLINGGESGLIAEYLKGLSNDPAKDARALIAHWNATFPDLAAYIGDQFEAVRAAGGSSFEVETLTGRKVRIDHRGNPRTVLSALWTVVEAEALDFALYMLPNEIEPSQGRLVLPMYDGLLLDAPRSKARAVAAAVKGVMEAAMEQAGVPGVAVKVEARERWIGPSIDLDQVESDTHDGPDVKESKDFTEPKKGLKDGRLGNLIDPALESMRRRRDGIEKPVPFPKAWRMTCDELKGGLWPGCWILVGATGAGKSQWAFQVAYNAAVNERIPVAYVGLELDPVGLIARLGALALHGKTASPTGAAQRVAWSDLYLGRPDNYGGDPLAWFDGRPGPGADALAAMRDAPFYTVFSEARSGFIASDIERIGKELAEERTDEHGPALLVVDFLQLLGEKPGSREELRERIGNAAYAARMVAVKYRITVLLISSTARSYYSLYAGAGETDKAKTRPLGKGDTVRFLGTGKESGDVEYAADNVLAICREPWNPGASPPPVWLAVAKARTGKGPNGGWVSYAFNGTTFTEEAVIEEPKAETRTQEPL